MARARVERAWTACGLSAVVPVFCLDEDEDNPLCVQGHDSDPSRTSIVHRDELQELQWSCNLTVEENSKGPDLVLARRAVVLVFASSSIILYREIRQEFGELRDRLDGRVEEIERKEH
ncbi:hypothetical protein B0H14DRAFT_2581793 [Mycena olivaceomarginata]|nr:hypothetical protein B0H14DRAFT_2581793 [Mycena olivaceomarginata]